MYNCIICGKDIPELRQKISTLSKEHWQNNDMRQQVSKSLKDYWSNQENRQKFSKVQKIAQNRPEIKQRKSEASKQMWENDIYRQKVSSSVKKALNRTDVKQKRSESMKIAYEIRGQEILQKEYITKKKHHSFSSSKPEQLAKKLLEQKFNEVHYQYRCEKYPYNCDFYIEDIDLFIELNFHWTHGYGPYNEKEQWCKEQLANWQEKAKYSCQYISAIATWAIKDIEKLQVLNNNQLNYKIFYKWNDFINWYNNIKIAGN